MVTNPKEEEELRPVRALPSARLSVTSLIIFGLSSTIVPYKREMPYEGHTTFFALRIVEESPNIMRLVTESLAEGNALTGRNSSSSFGFVTKH